MKKIILTAIIIAITQFSYAQPNTFPSSGNVGIGTTSPVNAAANASWLTINGSTYSGGIVYSVNNVPAGYSFVQNDGNLTH